MPTHPIQSSSSTTFTPAPDHVVHTLTEMMRAGIDSSTVIKNTLAAHTLALHTRLRTTESYIQTTLSKIEESLSEIENNLSEIKDTQSKIKDTLADQTLAVQSAVEKALANQPQPPIQPQPLTSTNLTTLNSTSPSVSVKDIPVPVSQLGSNPSYSTDSSRHTCRACNRSFKSNKKLFKHVTSSSHARPTRYPGEMPHPAKCRTLNYFNLNFKNLYLY